jgi:hypothetical protein
MEHGRNPSAVQHAVSVAAVDIAVKPERTQSAVWHVVPVAAVDIEAVAVVADMRADSRPAVVEGGMSAGAYRSVHAWNKTVGLATAYPQQVLAVCLEKGMCMIVEWNAARMGDGVLYGAVYYQGHSGPTQGDVARPTRPAQMILQSLLSMEWTVPIE